ncbi:hypothetical protein KP509_10G011100 [Ceratopteris richardii]|uniref:Uncharacterized protein n=1 Tax=Ceratopteris richardii TaxID=49495 RepID=A0A8T2TWK6_CERRI|nr:hypothetical protein KP509_10G011100 [Ceratopteris richardii]
MGMDSVLTILRQFVKHPKASSTLEFSIYGISSCLIQMEETFRSKKFHFPGYDGALPKAVRTSRGQSSCYKKSKNESPTYLNSIELLATVAGQFLHDKSLRAENVGIEEVFTTQTMNFNKKASISHGSLSSTECPFTAQKSKYQSLQEQKKQENMKRKCAIEGISCKDVVSRNDFCQEDSKDVQFPVPIGAMLTCNREGISTDKLFFISKEDGLTPTPTSGMQDPRTPLCHNSGVLEASNIGCDSLKNKDMGGCRSMTSQDGTPLPLNSRVSEETLTSVHKQPCTPCIVKPVDRHLELSQNLVSLGTKDDDDNSSDLFFFQSTEPPEPSMHLIDNAHPIQLQQTEVYCQEVPATETRIKRTEVGDQLKGKKRKRHVDQSMPDELQCLDSVGKYAQVGPAPVTSKGLHRSMKQKTKEKNVNITSFRVPELSLNLPETATVASLKKAVMEAAVNLLGGGLHVCVLQHGKRIYDDNSTLVQMGIAHKDRLDSLAFMLEPSGVLSTNNVGDSGFDCSKGIEQYSAWMESASNMTDVDAEMDASNNGTSKELQIKNGDLINNVDGCEKLRLCEPSEIPQAAALIVHPQAEHGLPVEIVTREQHSGSFSGKRRTRRPFTVLEVEALVQAVEMLGTGRWREVKEQVFSHARHRTYVDLKDKWKTLVHTARIAPHQRRGEPVPQELLDRVLQAHTYWMMQLAKQQEDTSIC